MGVQLGIGVGTDDDWWWPPQRITASNTGAIAKMRATTKRSKKVQELLYSGFKGNKATTYGSEKEEIQQDRSI